MMQYIFRRFKLFQSKSGLYLLLCCILATAINGVIVDPLHEVVHAREEIPRCIRTFLFYMDYVPLYFFYPVASFIADVYTGRYKMVVCSMWIMWFGLLLSAMGFASQGCMSVTLTNTLKLAASFVMSVGRTGMMGNVLQLATDQMQDASTEELSSFVWWFMWTQFCGMSISHLQSMVITKWYAFVSPLALATCFSAVICVHCCWSHAWFMKEHVKSNPYRTIFKVLNFARKHKVPLRCTALVNDEESLPSRINLGKHKYGGPFSNEQVEDVKTSLWIIALLLVFSLFIGGIVDFASFYIPKLLAIHIGLSGSKVIFFSNYFNIIGIVFVPTFEFVIYPSLRRYIPRMFERLLIGLLLLLTSIASDLILDASGHATTHTNVSCLFLHEGDGLQFSPWVLAMPTLIGGLGYTLASQAGCELVLAQTPYAMKGMMVGLVFVFGWGIPMLIGSLTALPFTEACGLHPHTNFSCGSAFFLTTFIWGLIGVGIFSLLAWKCKYRQRDEVGRQNALL